MAEFGEGVIYLALEDVLGFYAEIFRCTVQEAGDQLRSRSGLEGALGRPRQYTHYADADLAAQAAVLAHGIAEGQPFIEGNKRTALAAMRAVLLVNGYQVAASQTERADWIYRLSEGASVEDLADWIRASLIPVSTE